MVYRYSAKVRERSIGPTAPRKRFNDQDLAQSESIGSYSNYSNKAHPLTNINDNNHLKTYEEDVKNLFDNIVPFLKKVSTLQLEEDFVDQAKKLSLKELGFELPNHLLEKAWVSSLDMRGLFAWCVFQSQQKLSSRFFNEDPLNGASDKSETKSFQDFLSDCGFHLLDVTPCSDGRLAHTIAYVLRIPFGSVRRRSHAGALFDIEKTVNRWVKTEHNRHRENKPNSVNEPTRYLKVVIYHFSSLDPSHQGCAAHGSDDSLAASSGLKRLQDFREAVENSFCCGASVDLLLIGLDTDTDAIRIHMPSADNETLLKNWVCAMDVYEKTKDLSPDEAMKKVFEIVDQSNKSSSDDGMIRFISRIISNNISQIDYVKQLHNGKYPDAGHAEHFIGVGIGFKEVHLRNLTYFAHLDTVEQGAPDLDVGVKIFKGLNVSRDLPIPVVIRFDYSGKVPGARDRAISDCLRVNKAISVRYNDLVVDGLLHTLLTVRDRDKKAPAEVVGSSLDVSIKEEH